MPYDDVLSNIIPHIQAWWNYLIIVFYLLGIVIFASGLIKHTSDNSQGAVTRLTVSIVIGAIFLNFPSFLDSLSQTVFKSGSIQSLSYRTPAHPGGNYIVFAFVVIALVGLIGIGRGLILLKYSARDGSLMGRALIHIFGGILCVNFEKTLLVIAASMGQDVQSIIGAITS